MNEQKLSDLAIELSKIEHLLTILKLSTETRFTREIKLEEVASMCEVLQKLTKSAADMIYDHL